jgi:hypothetical protein
MKHTTISFYTNAQQKTGSVTTVQQVIKMIRGEDLQVVTTQYRTLEDGPDKDDYKKTRFPAVTWSGIFKKRKGEEILTHSGLMCLDIDKLTIDQHNAFKKLLSDDDHTFILFTSPSGIGLKWVIKIDNDAANHLHNFKALEVYAKQEYGVTIDTKCKDTTRLCFLCRDSSVYVNWDSVLFNPEHFQVQAATPPADRLTTKESTQLKQQTGESVNEVYEFTLSKYSYAEGGRNDFIFHFGLNCARKGIDEFDALGFALDLATDLKEHEVKSTIVSSFNTIRNAGEIGKYQKRKKKQSKKKVKGNSSAFPTTSTMMIAMGMAQVLQGMFLRGIDPFQKPTGQVPKLAAKSSSGRPTPTQKPDRKP